MHRSVYIFIFCIFCSAVCHIVCRDKARNNILFFHTKTAYPLKDMRLILLFVFKAVLVILKHIKLVISALLFKKLKVTALFNDFAV